MDVLCVGMYRACSTWQYEVAAHLVERFHGGERVGYVASPKYVPYRRGTARSWRVLKSHEGGPAFGRALRDKKALALYAIRDPRDVVYSMMHKRQQDFDSFVRQGMIHQILANDRFWNRQPRARVLVQRYEQLIRDGAAGVRAIGAHLNVALSSAECARIAEEYSFSSNQRRANAAAETMRRQGLDPGDPANVVCFDQHSLLHWNHLRDGRAGGWRERATPRERAILAELLTGWISAHGYERDEAENDYRLAIEDRELIARGWLACRMRCASLRFPRLSQRVKSFIGMTTAFEARPIEVASAPAPRSERAA